MGYHNVIIDSSSDSETDRPRRHRRPGAHGKHKNKQEIRSSSTNTRHYDYDGKRIHINIKNQNHNDIEELRNKMEEMGTHTHHYEEVHSSDEYGRRRRREKDDIRRYHDKLMNESMDKMKREKREMDQDADIRKIKEQLRQQEEKIRELQQDVWQDGPALDAAVDRLKIIQKQLKRMESDRENDRNDGRGRGSGSGGGGGGGGRHGRSRHRGRDSSASSGDWICDDCRGWTRAEIEAELALEELRQRKQEDANKRHVEDAFIIAKYQAMEKEEKYKQQVAEIREKIEIERIKAEMEERERKKKLAELKADAIDEFKKLEAAKEAQRREAAEKAEKDFRERLQQLACANGMTEDETKAFLEGKKVVKTKETLTVATKVESNDKFFKVHNRFLLPSTLAAFGIPWEWDPDDADYIIILTPLSESEKETLFRHSEMQRRSQRALPDPNGLGLAGPELVELKVNDKKRDKLFLVRKKGKTSVVLGK